MADCQRSGQNALRGHQVSSAVSCWTPPGSGAAGAGPPQRPSQVAGSGEALHARGVELPFRPRINIPPGLHRSWQGHDTARAAGKCRSSAGSWPSVRSGPVPSDSASAAPRGSCGDRRTDLKGHQKSRPFAQSLSSSGTKQAETIKSGHCQGRGTQAIAREAPRFRPRAPCSARRSRPMLPARSPRTAGRCDGRPVEAAPRPGRPGSGSAATCPVLKATAL